MESGKRQGPMANGWRKVIETKEIEEGGRILGNLKKLMKPFCLLVLKINFFCFGEHVSYTLFK